MISDGWRLVALVRVRRDAAVAMGLGDETVLVVPGPGLAEPVGVGAGGEVAALVEGVRRDGAGAVDDAGDPVRHRRR